MRNMIPMLPLPNEDPVMTSDGSVDMIGGEVRVVSVGVY